ncbi:UNVERIFIED_CONTAM: hypothetical protein Slati_4278400 [Sesamum latifolium]|uniref:Uncharacterized protein n=1 Tax=Sesamum latifolium TaxID=2727402 RepID=A0AAW2TCJ8_9LAMI
MFSKYLRDYFAGDKGGGTPPSRSPRGTPASSGSKGKRPMSPPSGYRASSLGTPPTGSSRPSATPPPPPPLKEEKGASSKPSRSPSVGLYVRSSSEQAEGEASSLALTLMRGPVTLEDRRLLAPLPREDLEKKVVLYLMKAYWNSRVDEFKKSDEYQQDVAKVAIPFLEYGFNACKEQFLAQGYPPSGEEPSFLDVKIALVQAPNLFANPPTPAE